jgi:hypothetical protein
MTDKGIKMDINKIPLKMNPDHENLPEINRGSTVLLKFNDGFGYTAEALILEENREIYSAEITRIPNASIPDTENSCLEYVGRIINRLKKNNIFNGLC